MDFNYVIVELLNNDQFLFLSDFVGYVLKYDYKWGLIIFVSDVLVDIKSFGDLELGNYINNWGVYKV